MICARCCFCPAGVEETAADETGSAVNNEALRQIGGSAYDGLSLWWRFQERSARRQQLGHRAEHSDEAHEEPPTICRSCNISKGFLIHRSWLDRVCISYLPPKRSDARRADLISILVEAASTVFDDAEQNRAASGARNRKQLLEVARSLAARMEEERDKLKELFFESGPCGISCSADGLITSVVAGGQACRKGVKVGMKIVKIRNTGLTGSHLEIGMPFHSVLEMSLFGGSSDWSDGSHCFQQTSYHISCEKAELRWAFADSRRRCFACSRPFSPDALADQIDIYIRSHRMNRNDTRLPILIRAVVEDNSSEKKKAFATPEEAVRWLRSDGILPTLQANPLQAAAAETNRNQLIEVARSLAMRMERMDASTPEAEARLEQKQELREISKRVTIVSAPEIDNKRRASSGSQLSDPQTQHAGWTSDRHRSMTTSSGDGKLRHDSEFGLSDEQLESFNWTTRNVRAMTGFVDECGLPDDADFGLSDEQLRSLNWTADCKLHADSDFGFSDEQLQEFNRIGRKLRSSILSNVDACTPRADSCVDLSDEQLDGFNETARRIRAMTQAASAQLTEKEKELELGLRSANEANAAYAASDEIVLIERIRSRQEELLNILRKEQEISEALGKGHTVVGNAYDGASIHVKFLERSARKEQFEPT